MLGRRVHAQRLVRPLLVVVAAEGVEGFGLRRPVGRGRLGQRQHGQMEALVPAVLLRLARIDPLQRNAELDEAHRQRRQPGDAGRGEGRAIVAAEAIRQAVLQEQPLEHRPGLLLARRAGRLQRQKIAARRIHHRQRLAAPSVACAEPALVVGRPHRIRSSQPPATAHCPPPASGPAAARPGHVASGSRRPSMPPASLATAQAAAADQ